MSITKFKGMTAIVTGASSGIGESFAKQLAANGTNLILVARRIDRLEQLKAELEETYKISVEVIGLDLSSSDAAQELFDATEGTGKQVDLLINNAGFGKQQLFTNIPLESQLNMIDLNIRTVTALSHLFAAKMKERGSGHILLVGSVVSYFAVPRMATYSASKAYVRHLGTAMNKEYKRYGVSTTVLSPGATATEFSAVADQEFDGWLEAILYMSADKTAHIGLSALASNKANVVPGISNKLTVLLMRLRRHHYSQL